MVRLPSWQQSWAAPVAQLSSTPQQMRVTVQCGRRHRVCMPVPPLALAASHISCGVNLNGQLVQLLHVLLPGVVAPRCSCVHRRGPQAYMSTAH